jgi:hypothetical protein
MSMDTIHPNLVEHALSRVKGGPFELFAQQFLSALIGPNFVPMGGTKDGGADGLISDRTLEDAADEHSFMQASVEENPNKKIRNTIKRLREFGRDPKSLRYITSRSVKHLDRVEAELTAELDVAIRIFDGNYIASHINDSPGTVAAFEHNLRSITEYLRFAGASPVIAESKYVKSPAVYVFLRQEVERRSGNATLVDAVTDALILWALDETDPDTEKLMSRTDIFGRICSTVPFAKAFVTDRLDDRLSYLSAKERSTGRIRWYRKRDLYCLPYETRYEIEAENLEDERLRAAVVGGLSERVELLSEGDLTPPEVEVASSIALRALQLLFEQEGLELAAFLSRGKVTSTLETVQDAVRAALDEAEVRPARRPVIGDHVLSALKDVFYASTDEERRYLGKLSRTYSLLFTLNTEPRLVSYFQDMAGDFHLYVGSDQLVRALSERYLDPKDQMTRNVLRLAVETGATLVLAQPVLDEVLGNLRASDKEFEVNFEPLGGIGFREAELMSPRILVRAYFHARHNESLGAKQPKSWQAFVNQFVDHNRLWKPDGAAQLRAYLVNEFRMVYESRAEIAALVDDEAQLHELTESIADIKDHQLARNDALMALAIYGRRAQLKEHAGSTEFGHRTWWLTGETRIMRYTSELVNQHHGARYMMRPEFLLNFLALAPSAADVRRTYANIFPTVLGVKLSKRMSEDVFHELMEKVRESDEVEPGRRKAQISQLIDKLKGDFKKPYLNGFTAPLG